jgi:hypothetical protein
MLVECISSSNHRLHCHLEDGLQTSTTNSRGSLICANRLDFPASFSLVTRYASGCSRERKCITTKAEVKVLCITVAKSLMVSIHKKASTEPHEGESIVRARSRYNAVLLPCAYRMPRSRTDDMHSHLLVARRQPSLTPSIKAVKCRQLESIVHRLCLVPLLLLLAAGALALQNGLPVLVELELGDDDL